MTSPSRTMYSLPSSRSLPASLAPASPLTGDEVLVGDHLGADEAVLEIRVDDARRLRRGRAGPHGPGAHFLHAGGEIGLQPQQLVGRRGSRGPGPARPAPGPSRNSPFSASSSCAISASMAAHTATTTAPSCVARAVHRIQVRIVGEAGLVHVGHVHDGLQREQVQLAQIGAILRRKLHGARRPAFVQMRAQSRRTDRAAGPHPCRRPWRPWPRDPRPSPRWRGPPDTARCR